MSSTLAEIAVTLKTTEANALRRCYGMKIGPACNRCAGSGRYSFNQIHGSRCYGCNGSGVRVIAERDHDAVLLAAKTAAADGSLDRYIAYLEASKIVKNANQTILDAWQATGISSEYNWRKAFGADMVQRDADISAINRKMSVAYDRVNQLSSKVSASSPSYQEQVVALADAMKSALADIAAAAEELRAYLESNPKETAA